MHLKLRHLEVFSALMEAGSVSHAAQRLNVTQPAVSVALARLEAEFGFRLFHRSKGFFAPTEEAYLLHAEAEHGLHAVQRVGRRAAEIRAGASGTLSLASNGAAAINLLPRLIAGFQAERPGVTIDLKLLGSRQIATLVAGRQVDIGLIDAPVPVAGLTAEIFRLPCVCILRADDPLAAEPVVRPEMLAGYPVVALSGEHRIDRELDGLLAAADVRVERRVAAALFAIARNLVAAGAGVALVDCLNGRMKLGDGVVWRRFEPELQFELALVMAQGRELPPSGRAFLDRLRAALTPP